MSGENFLKWNGKAQTTGNAHRTHRLFWQAALMLLPATAACGQPSAQQGRPADQQASRPERERRAPFTTTVAGDFEQPWAIAFLPDRPGPRYREEGRHQVVE